MLTLRARPERAIGWNGQTYGYTSGLVSTGGSDYSDPAREPGFVFTYGYAEARIQVPAGHGLVPAFWLAPTDHSWPPEALAWRVLGKIFRRPRRRSPASDGCGQAGPDPVSTDRTGADVPVQMPHPDRWRWSRTCEDFGPRPLGHSDLQVW